MGEIAEITGVIYRIDCIAVGRFYIGSSTDFAGRRRGHLHRLRKGFHHSRHLQRCFDKYGEGSLSFSVVESGVAVAALLDRESEIIRALKPAFNGSAVSATRRGARQSDECKAKVSAANSGRKHSEREVERRRTAMLGNRRADGNRNALKVTDSVLREIRELHAQGFGCRRIAKATGLNKTTILNVFNGRHRHGGYNG